MSKHRIGFRRSDASSGGGGGRSGDASGPSGPFSQAQITHLMKTEFARAQRHKYPLSCVLLRVDRMRELADTHGSELRFELKQHLNRIVEEKTRGHDHLGAMSDGTYLLILPHTDTEEARVVADRIRGAFERLELVAGTSVLSLTVSLGIAACEDRDTMFFDTLVSQAEVALEQAVAAGGSRVVVFERRDYVRPSPQAEDPGTELAPDGDDGESGTD